MILLWKESLELPENAIVFEIVQVKFSEDARAKTLHIVIDPIDKWIATL